jgi:molecular chaperone DnaJ
MRNPYEVLGVPNGASMERVNAAYRELSRQYTESHQQSKLDELNAAYDSIVMSSSSTQSGSYYYSGNDYSDIRAKINSHRLEDAQMLLDGIPQQNRDAEWYYLKGTIYQKKGWLEEAMKNLGTASNMDPTNDTYRKAYENVSQAANGGYKAGRKSSSSDDGCDFCSICTGLICADSCCECMGGDLIPCC